MIRSFINKIKPVGMAAKVIKFAVLFVCILGVVFFTIFGIQIKYLGRIVENEGEELTGQVEEDSRAAMDNLTRQSLKELSYRAADKTDDELWVNSYELQILAAQVEDVMAHPENYDRIPVSPPSKEKGGELSLQLLAPNGYENIPEDTMASMERLANLAPIMATYVGEYTVDCYISTPDGTTIAMDTLSDRKYDEKGEIKPYDATTRMWFQEAVKTKDVYFTPAVHSFFYDWDIVVYSMPVYVEGELVAVLEGSLKLDRLRNRVEQQLFTDSGFNILISKQGQLVSSSRTDGELMMRSDLEEDIRKTVNPGLKDVINKGLAGENDVTIVEVDGKEYYVGYGPLVTVGWTQLSFASKDVIMEPTEKLVLETGESYDKMDRRLDGAFQWTIILMLVITLVLVTITNIIASELVKKEVAPINHMTGRLNEISGENMIFEMEDIYKTGDELETLARAFSKQSHRLTTYMEENIRISAEKERIDAEMAMATQIQASMLPGVEPMFSGHVEYDLYAMTDSAKDVGGDFYDFFYVDEDHLAIEIADVSGKGITAALFMALSKQMIQSQMIINNGDPVEALTVANLRLIEESVPDMFVTVWLGILTLSTGELTFVDAGHEYPAIGRAGEEFSIEKDVHSMAVAALKKARFKVNEMTLQPGDTVYLYTDGVTEAHNESGEMFGMERLSNALNEVVGCTPEEIDAHVRKRVSEFAGETEQFDDITTLCFRFESKSVD